MSTLETNDLFAIRDGAPTDFSFIYATWLHGLYFGCEFFRDTREKTFYDNYKRVIKNILEERHATITVSCLKEDHDVILGYSVSEKDCLHWVFVKESWRKIGIAKSLIPFGIVVVSNQTKVGRSIKPKGWDFNPFLI